MILAIRHRGVFDPRIQIPAFPQMILLASLAMFFGSARAAQDNKGDAPDGVVLKYCTCMNNKMSDNETQSITQWEKSHPAERTACDKEAGWK